jgi:hypothetical protein
MNHPAAPQPFTSMPEALGAYRVARHAPLASSTLPASNRDPLAEFSEHRVQALLGGTFAASRVQANWDLTPPYGDGVPLRYLADPAGRADPTGRWVNEHAVRKCYALVLFEAFTVVSVLVLPIAGHPAIHAALANDTCASGRSFC